MLLPLPPPLSAETLEILRRILLLCRRLLLLCRHSQQPKSSAMSSCSAAALNSRSAPPLPPLHQQPIPNPSSRSPSCKMQNEEGQMMDLYISRKCSATNRLITAKDHAAVQINIGHLDKSGVYTGQFTTVALCGFIRA